MINATGDVIIKDGKIHMDAGSDTTGFLWGYKITFDNGNIISKAYPKGGLTCRHDEYYPISQYVYNPNNFKMTVEIIEQTGAKEWTYLRIENIDIVSCGFKVHGTTWLPALNFKYSRNGHIFKGDDVWHHLQWYDPSIVTYHIDESILA